MDSVGRELDKEKQGHLSKKVGRSVVTSVLELEIWIYCWGAA